jgi:pimeloyl-ACP methyl ester carboxylesterase
MPFANNQGVRIHYEVEGQGPPLVLQYGQYFPLDVWYELGYASALRNDCQLILVDARGQGDSDKPHDPEAYQIELMVKDIVSVLDELRLEKANYMGYSSGGAIGFAIAKYAPERCRSLIVGGYYPYPDEDPEGDVTFRNGQIEKLEKESTADFVARIERMLARENLPALSNRMRTRMLTHDTQALIAWMRHTIGSPSFEDILSKISVPCLLYYGEHDTGYSEAQRAAQEIPGGSFVGIPNEGHLEAGRWINILRQHIIQIVKDTGLLGR